MAPQSLILRKMQENLEDRMGLGILIRRYRKERSLTQPELAKKAGIGMSYITLIETGRRKNVSQEYLNKIANALKLNNSSRELLYCCAGYVSPKFKKLAAKKRYPYLFEILTSKPEDVSLENFSEAMFDAIKVIRDNIPGTEKEKNEKLFRILIIAMLNVSKKK